MSWAKVGEACKCINQEGWRASYFDDTEAIGPKPDEECVVTAIGHDEFEPVIWVRGYPEDYPVRLFVPLSAESSDISLFKRIAETAPSLEDAE